MVSKTELGAAAERRAAAFLQTRGLHVLARNLRCKAGELDLVCLEGEVLVIVEVRLRGRADFGGALASVTPHKQRKLLRATQYFWQRNADWRARMLRFDVLALRTASAGLESGSDAGTDIEWIRDAFRATR